MEYLLWYVIILMVIFLVFFVVQYVIPSRKGTLEFNKVVIFLKKKYKLKMDAKNVRLLSKILVFINSVIISIPIMIIIFVELSYISVLLISLSIFVPLILISYNLLGYILRKKGW